MWKEYAAPDIAGLVSALERIKRGTYDGIEVSNLSARDCREIARQALAKFRSE
jgi:hypothetical protein